MMYLTNLIVKLTLSWQIMFYRVAVAARKTVGSYFLQMRYECADIDQYNEHINILDQVILGQLRCLQ